MPRGRDIPPTDTSQEDDQILAITPSGGGYTTVRVPATGAGTSPGVVGPRGSKGPDASQQGSVGAAGLPGDQGAQGPKGPAGGFGPAGAGGLPGTNGTNGANFPETTFTDTEDMDCFESYAVGATVFDKGIGWNGPWVTSNASAVTRSLLDGRTKIRMEITNGEVGRVMSWGNSWNELHICMLLRLNASDASFDTDWAVGLCSGSTHKYGSASCINFLGLQGQSTCTFTKSTGLNSDLYTHDATRAVSKVGASVTSLAGPAFSAGRIWDSSEHSQNFVQIWFTRGPWGSPKSGTITIVYKTAFTGWDQFTSTKGWNNVRHSQRMFNTPTLYGANAETYTTTFDDTPGLLDTFNFWWPDATHPVEIAAIDIYKVT